MKPELRSVIAESADTGGQAEQALSVLPLAVVTLDSQGLVQYANQAAQQLLGLEAESAGGHRLADLLRAQVASTENPDAAVAALQNGLTVSGLSLRGGDAVIHLQVAPLSSGWVVSLSVVGSNQASTINPTNSNGTAAHGTDSERDALTGLLNREGLVRRMEALVSDAGGSCRTHAFLMLDLDEFKLINDLSGHYAGDVLLKQLGELLDAELHTGDIVARLGGDEFGVLLSNVEGNEAASVARRLLACIEKTQYSWDGRIHAVSASIGVVPIDEKSLSTKRVISQADTALYAAKDAGRNRFHVFRPGDQEMLRRNSEMEWVGKINEAIEQNHFCLAVQGIVPARGQQAGEHYEVLLRLRREGRLIGPNEFLPAAERFGMMDKIDRWVVKNLLDYLEANPEAAQKIDMCAINLSGLSLINPDFLKFLNEQVSRPHVRPEMLCFEVTETAAIKNMTHARQFIQEIHARGCKFSLDDFGSGMSSFGYLRQFPVDYLKVDGIFVRDMDTDPVHCSMVRAINEVAHALGKRTIAEFVVNEQIKRILQDMGVDYLQGYCISEPRLLADNASAVCL